MSDLDEILELIASFFAVLVLLLIILAWLEATMSKDYVPLVRRPYGIALAWSGSWRLLVDSPPFRDAAQVYPDRRR